LVRCRDGTLYTGVTNDILERIATHNAGRGAKYTRGRLPVTLVYRERTQGRGAALRREHEIKRLSKAAKLLLCVRAKRGRRSLPAD
jgi:putative endonuclease